MGHNPQLARTICTVFFDSEPRVAEFVPDPPLNLASPLREWNQKIPVKVFVTVGTVATFTEPALVGELEQIEQVLVELRPEEGVQKPSTRDLRQNFRRYNTSTPVSDALLAVRHDVAGSEVKRPLREEEDPILPVRSEPASQERFHGKHGNSVIVKRK